MKDYCCIIFDLDGTLMDTSPGILNCIDYIVARYNLVLPSAFEKRSFIGPPIEKSFQRHYGCTREFSLELASAWRTAYKEKFLFEAEAYPGVYDLLRWLRGSGMKTAVATNKREDYTEVLLKRFDFWPLLDCVIGSDFSGSRTKADMIALCMNQLGTIGCGQCLMIGDTIGDMTAAHETGVDFLGVTYGFGFTKERRGADCWTADSCKGIQDFLQCEF